MGSSTVRAGETDQMNVHLGEVSVVSVNIARDADPEDERDDIAVGHSAISQLIYVSRGVRIDAYTFQRPPPDVLDRPGQHRAVILREWKLDDQRVGVQRPHVERADGLEVLLSLPHEQPCRGLAIL